jgi:hypothetical protein
VAASIANTRPGPNTATSTPAAAGPPALKKLPEKLIRALACCNCPAGTVSGTSPADAGPKNDWAAP